MVKYREQTRGIKEQRQGEQVEAGPATQPGEAGSCDLNSDVRDGKAKTKINIHEEATHSERVQ